MASKLVRIVSARVKKFGTSVLVACLFAFAGSRSTAFAQALAHVEQLSTLSVPAGSDTHQRKLSRSRQDLREAHGWRKEAEHGKPAAQVQMGLLYEEGMGVPKSYRRAQAWYRKAAEQGWGIAFASLGAIYAYGLGVPVNDELAYVFYGLQPDFSMEKSLATKLTSAQLQNARSIINHWRVGMPLPTTTVPLTSARSPSRSPVRKPRHTAPAALSGRSVCTRLATKMRRSPEVVERAFATPARSQQPWIVFSKSKSAEGEAVTRHLFPEWRRQVGWPGFWTIETLPDTDLFLATSIAGSGDCYQNTFGEWKPGSALRLLDGPTVIRPCARVGQSGGLAMVLGRPAYIESGPLNPADTGTVMHIAPWQGGRWGEPCQLAIRFAYRYPVTLRYCGPDRALCSAALKVAPAVERRYSAYSAEQLAAFNGGYSILPFRFQDGRSAQGRALVAQARRMMMSRAPSSLRTVVPIAITLFPMSLDGKLHPASVSGGVDPTSLLRSILPDAKRYFGVQQRKPRPGSLLVVYQAPTPRGHPLIPLAVLTMHSRIDGVKAIQARHDSAP
ncbi:MAG: tetratricopeptide repeat protein [Bryobacteraceae bacterium]